MTRAAHWALAGHRPRRGGHQKRGEKKKEIESGCGRRRSKLRWETGSRRDKKPEGKGGVCRGVPSITGIGKAPSMKKNGVVDGQTRVNRPKKKFKKMIRDRVIRGRKRRVHVSK